MPRTKIYKSNADRQRAYRRRKKADKAVHYSSVTSVWQTPPELFQKLHEEFLFQWDLAALPSNALCERYYTPETDALQQKWQGTCFLNPPYGREIGAWVQKASVSAAQNGATVVCLLPARTDTHWYHAFVSQASEVRYLKGRLKFKFGNSYNSAPFPSMVVVFRPGVNEEDPQHECSD